MELIMAIYRHIFEAIRDSSCLVGKRFEHLREYTFYVSVYFFVKVQLVDPLC